MATSNFTFPRSHRLGSRRHYDGVFDARVRQSGGPLTVFAAPNGLGHCRLGLSLTRRLGNAVRRNRVKRLLREAYRLHQHELPAGYDMVVVVRPHEPLPVEEYAGILLRTTRKLDDTWKQRTEPTQQ
jgi:ribonuclease P protein component